MLKGIDHIVIIVPDLDAAIKSYQHLGFTVVPGGRHPIGSHNALIAFQDGAYIELIAFFEPNEQHRWYQLLGKGGGLIDYCMQTDDLNRDIAAFRAAGVALADIMPLSRVRPDGYKLDWVLSVPVGDFQGVAPFLIEDITPRTERVPSQDRHDNDATGIDTLTVAVRDVERIAGWFRHVLGGGGEAVGRDDLSADGVRFVIGPHTFDFVAPRDANSPLQSWLQERGESTYEVTLRTSNGKRGALDSALAMNARIRLV